MNEQLLKDVITIMEDLDHVAKKRTTDPKVYVGAALAKLENNTLTILTTGVNMNEHYNEKELGQTYREFLFGSRDKKYRPWDKIIHAEENAIVHAIKQNINDYNTAIVTRYPCEKCAQLLVYKNIKNVFYGRKFKISEETEEIFKNAGVTVYHVKEYEGDTNDDNK